MRVEALWRNRTFGSALAMGAEVARAAYHCFIFTMSELADEIAGTIGEGAHEATRTAA